MRQVETTSQPARHRKCNDLRLARHAAPQLTAGGVDLIPLARSHLHVQTAVAQDFEKPLLRFVRRLAIRQARNGIVWNHIEKRRSPTQDRHEFPRMLGPIVQLAEQHILEGQTSTVVGKETIGRVDHGLNRNRLVDRHDLGPQLVVRSMQRDGEMIVCMQLGQPIHRRRQTDGGDRHVPAADAEPVGPRRLIECGQEPIKVR